MEYEENLVLNSKDDKWLHDKKLDEKFLIPNKKNREVYHNIEFNDLEPSLIFEEIEKRKDESELGCLEFLRYVIEFVEVPI